MNRFLLTLAVLLASTAAVQAQGAAAPAAQATAPAATSASIPPAPVQPIAFSHKQHMQDAKMSCNDCHAPRGDGSTVAMPQPATCMRCHNTIATDSPDIKRVAEAAKNEDPIRWVRVYRVPSFVTFSHKTHSAATCEQCHGPVAERTAIALEKDTSMGTCIACHQAKGAPSTCDTCHAIMTKNGRPPFDTDATVLARLHIEAAGKTIATELAKSGTTEPAWHSRLRATPRLSALAGFLYAPAL